MFIAVLGRAMCIFSSFFTKKCAFKKNAASYWAKRDCHQTLRRLFILLCVKIQGVLRHPELQGIFSPPCNAKIRAKK
jgi:hypothetical protein